MAFGTPVTKGAVFNVTNGPSCTIASVAFTAGRLYIAFAAHHRTGAAGTHANGSISGTAGGWTLAQDGATWNGGLRRSGAWVYVATTTETVTVTYNPDTNNNSCTMLVLIEIPSGFDSGTPVAQSDETTAAAALSVTATLAAAPTAGNLSVSGGANSDATSVINPRTNWTELNEAQGSGTASDSGAIESQYKTALDAEQSASASVSATNRDWGWLHLEIKAAAAPPPFDVSFGLTSLRLCGVGH
jgi:hypothetical protein